MISISRYISRYNIDNIYLYIISRYISRYNIDNI